jgi:hypothetical protein
MWRKKLGMSDEATLTNSRARGAAFNFNSASRPCTHYKFASVAGRNKYYLCVCARQSARTESCRKAVQGGRRGRRIGAEWREGRVEGAGERASERARETDGGAGCRSAVLLPGELANRRHDDDIRRDITGNLGRISWLFRGTVRGSRAMNYLGEHCFTYRGRLLLSSLHLLTVHLDLFPSVVFLTWIYPEIPIECFFPSRVTFYSNFSTFIIDFIQIIAIFQHRD